MQLGTCLFVAFEVPGQLGRHPRCLDFLLPPFLSSRKEKEKEMVPFFASRKEKEKEAPPFSH